MCTEMLEKGDDTMVNHPCGPGTQGYRVITVLNWPQPPPPPPPYTQLPNNKHRTDSGSSCSTDSQDKP
jgi:hypothetical protein